MTKDIEYAIEILESEIRNQTELLASGLYVPETGVRIEGNINMLQSAIDKIKKINK